MPNEIKDWTIKLGMDLSDVEKGLKRIDGLLDKLNRKSAKIAGGSVRGSGARATTSGGGSGTVHRGLEGRQFRAETRIMSTEERGQNILRRIDPNTTDARLKAIREEVGKTVSELGSLRVAAKKATTGLQFDKISRSVGQLNRDLGGITQSFNRTTRAMERQKIAANGLRDSMRNLVRTYASVFAIVGVGRSFFRVGKQLESLDATLLAASGSTKQAAIDFEFIRRTSLGLGIELREVAGGYAKIGAASRAANFSTAQTREIFLAASESARSFGLNAQRTNLVFLAFGQILSKGKVSMEELRRQLGEQIPGAFQIAARSMNMTTKELDKMVSSGKLSSEEFLPKFAAELRKTVRETGALAASLKKVEAEQQRFTSQMQLNVKAGFEAGKGGFASFFQDLSGVLHTLTPAFKAFGRVFGGTVAVIGTAVRLLMPLINFVITPFTNLINLMGAGFSAEKSIKDLTLLDRSLRVIGNTLKSVVGLFFIAFGLVEEFNKLVSIDGSEIFAEQIKKIHVTIQAFVGFLKIVPNTIKTLLGKTFLGKAISALGGAFSGIGKFIVTKLPQVLGKAFNAVFQVVNKLPLFGLLFRIPALISRMSSGDYVGAAIEVGAGVASFVPGTGTAAAVTADIALLLRDRERRAASTKGTAPVSVTSVVNVEGLTVEGAADVISEEVVNKMLSGVARNN